MAVAVGTTAYGYGAPPCSGAGLQWTKDAALEHAARRAAGARRPRFETAGKRHRRESAVRICGFRAGDVSPKVRGLRSAVERLERGRSGGTVAGLPALCLPDGHISGMGGAAGAARSGGSA